MNYNLLFVVTGRFNNADLRKQDTFTDQTHITKVSIKFVSKHILDLLALVLDLIEAEAEESIADLGSTNRSDNLANKVLADIFPELGSFVAIDPKLDGAFDLDVVAVFGGSLDRVVT